MYKHDLLRALHERVQPRTYFEIGVRKGRSLGLSRTTSIGVDPFFIVSEEVNCDVQLVRATSDEFFARAEPLAHFPEPVIDLAFIDGMHLAEFALRDFINTERYCHAGSVIVVDDILPRNTVEAGRGRAGSAKRGAWAGDIYKVTEALRAHRPDLVVLEVDTRPTGSLVVLLPDPENRVLLDRYDELVPQMVSPDPQNVPESTFARSKSIKPEFLLDAPIWDEIRKSRGVFRSRNSRQSLAASFARHGLVQVGGTR